MTKVKGLVHFNQDGHMIHHAHYWNNTNIQTNTRPQTDVFPAVMKFLKLEKYTSYVAKFADENGRQYYMSNNLFQDVIQYMICGNLRGNFTFKQQGNYVSLKYLPDA